MIEDRSKRWWKSKEEKKKKETQSRERVGCRKERKGSKETVSLKLRLRMSWYSASFPKL